LADSIRLAPRLASQLVCLLATEARLSPELAIRVPKEEYWDGGSAEH